MKSGVSLLACCYPNQRRSLLQREEFLFRRKRHPPLTSPPFAVSPAPASALPPSDRYRFAVPIDLPIGFLPFGCVPDFTGNQSCLISGSGADIP